MQAYKLTQSKMAFCFEYDYRFTASFDSHEKSSYKRRSAFERQKLVFSLLVSIKISIIKAFKSSF